MKRYLIILFCLILFLGAGCSTKEPTIEDKKAYAWICAKDAVKDNLKAPSTAKFPGYDENNVKHIENEIFIIKSYVDSQNGFGAILDRIL